MSAVQCSENNDLTIVGDIGFLAGAGTDYEWHMQPDAPHAFCGGCGRGTEQCHPGVCCSQVKDLMGMLESVCGWCETRVQTGQIRCTDMP